MDGILIAMKGGGILEDCEMFENKYNGVSVREASSVALNHCRISNQKGAGIFVHARSGLVEECEVFGIICSWVFELVASRSVFVMGLSRVGQSLPLSAGQQTEHCY
jgi:hypothetical protein